LLVVVDDEAVDGDLQIDDALEDAALEGSLDDGRSCRPDLALDGVEEADEP